MPAFYELIKEERLQLVTTINTGILSELEKEQFKKIRPYFANPDTYIRKAAYLATGKIYSGNKKLQPVIVKTLEQLLQEDNFRIRQTVINAAGEIGKTDFMIVEHFFDTGLFDTHHSARNAVIGSVKKMGEVNPEPVLQWAKKYLHHPDKEIRREICHGIELRGRKYPQDVLPLLQELHDDSTARVKNTLVHVLGQIAYKKGCLQIVVEHLKKWHNKQLVRDALDEIIDVHHRYKKFSSLTQDEATIYIAANFPGYPLHKKIKTPHR